MKTSAVVMCETVTANFVEPDHSQKEITECDIRELQSLHSYLFEYQNIQEYQYRPININRQFFY